MHGIGKRRCPSPWRASPSAAPSASSACRPLGGSWSKWFLLLGSDRCRSCFPLAFGADRELAPQHRVPDAHRRATPSSASPRLGADTATATHTIPRDFTEAPLFCLVPICITALGCFALFFYADGVHDLLAPLVDAMKRRESRSPGSAALARRLRQRAEDLHRPVGRVPGADRGRARVCSCGPTTGPQKPPVHEHHGFSFERWPGFYALYGFVACVALVLAAKELRKLLMRSTRTTTMIESAAAGPGSSSWEPCLMPLVPGQRGKQALAARSSPRRGSLHLMLTAPRRCGGPGGLGLRLRRSSWFGWIGLSRVWGTDLPHRSPGGRASTPCT